MGRTFPPLFNICLEVSYVSPTCSVSFNSYHCLSGKVYVKDKHVAMTLIGWRDFSWDSSTHIVLERKGYLLILYHKGKGYELEDTVLEAYSIYYLFDCKDVLTSTLNPEGCIRHCQTVT